MGIQRWDIDTERVRMDMFSEGIFVLLSDHEKEVVRLRAELAAKSKDAARWDWIMNNYYGGDLTRTQKVIGACFSREAMEAAIDKDLGE